MRWLICGSRHWKDRETIRLYVGRFIKSDSVVITGGCRGADSIASEEALKVGAKIIIYPALWKKHGKAAGPIRNSLMLTDGKPDSLLAFTLGGSGTADMIRKAEDAGIPTIVVHGNMVTE